MPLIHIVKRGDCFSSIAKEYGFLQKSLWEHPLNADLRKLRKNMNILFPGDKVTIPDAEIREEQGSTEKKHTFKVKLDKVKLQLRLLQNETPRAGIPYSISIDDKTIQSKTDSDGWIRLEISATAESANLILFPGTSKAEEYTLQIGHLDPAEETSGVIGRLSNLGFYQGDLNDEIDEAFEIALRGFQRKHKLQETGRIDGQTKSKITEIHGS
jgi:hypothetical protein